MNRFPRFSRRRFLQYSGLGSLALLAAPAALLRAAPRPSTTFVPDVELALSATSAEVPLLPGHPTRVWRYEGKIVKGRPENLTTWPDTYVGPAIRVRNGQRVRLRFENKLTEQSNIHWHGLHVPDDMDGHPRHAVGTGGQYVYDFEIKDRAGTYWYHPHPHGRTGKQIYSGLTGLFLIEDEEEQSLDLPRDQYDVMLVLQDRTFDADNQLVFLADGASGGGMGGMMGGGMMDMMTRMMGFLGERIVVNGQPDFTLPVATRPYRLRLLNASNARIFKLAWQDGSPLTVIATDGGLLAQPLSRPYVTLAPGERIELWVDFSRYPVGTTLALRSLAFAGDMAMGDRMMGGGMMGMMGGSSLPNGAELEVLKIRVDRKERTTARLPAQLSAIERYRVQDAVNHGRPRRFDITMGHMQWGINGRSFEMEGVADDEVVQLDTLEVWELANDASRGMMGMMAHPIHIHGLQFQIIERTTRPGLAGAWRSVSAGYVDAGWKDEVLLMPGETAKVLLRFKDYTGLFLFHCHMLEHGDTGLMRNYRVRA